MEEIVASLQRLGFGEYEAKAYITLLQRSPLTGYELAKISGLPRANVYAVLPKLEEKGAVLRVDTPTGPRYSPVPPLELTQRLSTRFQDELHTARRSLEEVSVPAEYEYVWNARGYDVVLETAGSLLGLAQERLLVATWPQEARALAGHLADAAARGVEITTLCLPACLQECGGCRGSIFRYQVAPERGERWLVVVQDGMEVLASEIGQGGEAFAVRTRQPILVELISWYVRHSIALATISADLGDRLPEMLSPETLTVLASVGPGGPGDGWLEHMRRAVGGQA
ncbi:MAG: hypothetical protein M3441_19850 [Chloroflexota bacterium]|nr:hypothetical protein [Chloroflexota bacterium]